MFQESYLSSTDCIIYVEARDVEKGLKQNDLKLYLYLNWVKLNSLLITNIQLTVIRSETYPSKIQRHKQHTQWARKYKIEG